MSLRPECPRCQQPPLGEGEDWRCPTHDVLTPLWRAAGADYDAFASYLQLSEGLATWLPWPLPPGWQVTDFGCVHGTDGPRAAVVGVVGATDPEGVVELSVVTEEPGVGLGARVGGVDREDPGREAGVGTPLLKVRVDGNAVPLWSLSLPGGRRPARPGRAGRRSRRPLAVGGGAARLRRSCCCRTFRSCSTSRGWGLTWWALPFGVVPPAW